MGVKEVLGGGGGEGDVRWARGEEGVRWGRGGLGGGEGGVRWGRGGC